MNFNEFIVQHELALRLGCFVTVLLLMAVWEIVAPRRSRLLSRKLRWTNNIGLVFLNTIILRLIFPTAAVGVTLFAEQKEWGLLHAFPVPYGLAIVLSVVSLDLIIYLQHVLVHAVPTLWRVHRVHHADLDYDLTTGARFHPIEIVLSMLIKFASIVVLGPPLVAVILFEIILNGMAMFNHGNVRLPQTLDRVLRWVIVTPDMHRVHHSVEDNETNSNFGFNLSIWDRVFGTYISQPRDGHIGMTIGIHQYRDPRQVNRLWGMLVLPFVGKVTGYAINRREWSHPEKND